MNLKRYPVKKPEIPPPCLYIVLKVFRYVEVGSTFSICVLTQSKGMTREVFTKATQNEPGIKYLVGI